MAVADRILAARKAFGVASRVVGNFRIARRLAGLDPRFVDRIELARPLHADRPRAAACLALTAGPRFDLLEVGQHIRERPAERALLRPAVVIATVAAREAGDINRGRATEDLAAHGFDAAIIRIRLGLALVAPVVHAMLVHHAKADGHMNERVVVPAAGFEHQHAHFRVFA